MMVRCPTHLIHNAQNTVALSQADFRRCSADLLEEHASKTTTYIKLGPTFNVSLIHTWWSHFQSTKRLREHFLGDRTLARRLQVHGTPPQDFRAPQLRHRAYRGEPHSMRCSSFCLKNHALLHLCVGRLAKAPPNSVGGLLRPDVFVSEMATARSQPQDFSDGLFWSCVARGFSSPKRSEGSARTDLAVFGIVYTASDHPTYRLLSPPPPLPFLYV